MFEWQKYSQDSTDVPHYQKLLEFINLRAQASETPTQIQKQARNPSSTKSVASHTASADDANANCPLCKNEKHPLYVCARFKALSHDKMMAVLKENKLCLNCLRSGHFVKQCRSIHHCRKCQKPHHTLLHVDVDQASQNKSTPTPSPTPTPSSSKPVTSHAAASLTPDTLLMTCRVLVESPDGFTMEARALLDSASSASFVSERLAQTLCLPRSRQNTRISGVAGITHASPLQSIATLRLSSKRPPYKKMEISMIVVPRVTCDLPLHPVTFDQSWTHLDDLHLADPDFGRPGKIDLLLGVDVFAATLLQGRRSGTPGSPNAFETEFGWVLAGCLDETNPDLVTTHHVSVASDDLLRRFWEIEERPNTDATCLSTEERSVIQHFKETHYRNQDGRFVIPLPRKPHVKPLGESRSQAVRRFLSLERSLCSSGQFEVFREVIEEYFQMGHAESVPTAELEKSQEAVFYLPMHAVRKESSTTTKIRAVFDASAKSSSGVSLNDLLLVGPTVHSPLIDVLLRFRFHRIALTTDVSRMYRAVELTPSDKDLHRFVWRNEPTKDLRDFRMNRVTFGVSASSFAANMAVKQNALDLALEYPQAAAVVEKSFYVDDGLTGADSIQEAIQLQKQLQDLFGRGGFLLRKWNSNQPDVLQHLPPELRDTNQTQTLPSQEEYTKTLGIEWNTTTDHFRLTISNLPTVDVVTKCVLVSDVAKTFDALGWFSPAIIKVKILMQRLWELKIDWDDPLPAEIHAVWSQWRTELKCLSGKHIPRCYYPDGVNVVAVELHGFSDASENAYSAVVYLRLTDSVGEVHTSIVMSKTKVAPIKRLTIPRLELCGAHLLSQLLYHIQQVFNIPLNCIYAWTDSTVVLNWLVGTPRRFKTFVGNRVSHIVELVSPDRWSHVNGTDNPADCASQGLFPSELLEHDLWWNGPEWLKLPSSDWPKLTTSPDPEPSNEEKEVCLHLTLPQETPLISLNRFSHFTRYK